MFTVGVDAEREPAGPLPSPAPQPPSPGGRTMVARDLQSLVEMPSYKFLRPEGGRRSAMPSAYTQNFYHTVFSTKQRINPLSSELESRSR